MTFNPENFNFKIDKLIPVDDFIETALYHPDFGYYTKKVCFGRQGDFITAPTISNLFSEIIGICLMGQQQYNGQTLQ